MCEDGDGGLSPRDAGVRPSDLNRDSGTLADLGGGGPSGSGVCIRDGWCWQNPVPQGDDLNAVWGSDPRHVWAVGSRGLIVLRSGRSYSAQPSGTTEELQGVWGADANNVWAVGDQGTILRWDGTAWATQPSGTTEGLSGVWGVDANNVWVVGDNGTIL